MPAFKQGVHQTIIQHNLCKRSDRLLVGCSAGPDSVSLVTVLHELNFKNMLLVYLNHGLRSNPEIQAEIQLVQNLAKTLKCDFYTRKLPVMYAHKRYKQSIESSAHILRKHMLQHLAKRLNASKIVLGHHHDDVVETAWMQLDRGNIFHLGMPIHDTHAEIPVIRPLYEQKKEGVLSYVKQKNMPYATDTSNQDLAFRRNQVRHEWLPKLNAMNPALSTHLLRSLNYAQAATATLHAEQAFNLHEYATHFECDMSVYGQKHEQQVNALIYRVLDLVRSCCKTQHGIHAALELSFSISYHQISSISKAIEKKKYGILAQLNSHVCVASYQNTLYITRKPTTRTHQSKLTLNTWTPIGSYSIKLSRLNKAPISLKSNESIAYITCSNYKELLVRTVNLDTDSMLKFGQSKTKKVKQLLQKAAYPSFLHPHCIVLADAAGPVWIPKLGVDQRALVNKDLKNAYKIEVKALTYPVVHVIS